MPAVKNVPKFKNRVKELRTVRAGDLLPNEKNWREHGKAQTEGLRAIMAEVGIADAVIAFETKKGPQADRRPPAPIARP